MLDAGLLAGAVFGGVLRISPALLWATVGDCLSQRSGHFNLGLEGIIACGALAAVLGAAYTGNPWLGVAAAAAAGGTLALVFCLICMLARVNELVVGIAMLIGGVALAQFTGAGLVAKPTVLLPVLDIDIGRIALQISAMLPLALVLAGVLAWLLSATRAGLLVRAAGTRGANTGLRLVGVRPRLVRVMATVVGGMCGGVAGACLSLFSPGGWSDQLATGVGITALTLTFIARTQPLVAVVMSVAFAGFAALGPALQVTLGTSNYHLLNTLPYIVALCVLMIAARGHQRVLS